MARKVITEELKNQIINEYKGKPIALRVLEEKYSLSRPTVSKILKDVPKYKKAQVYNPELNEHFFENIDNEVKAYFLGLIIADGNVFVDSTFNRQASISITLDSKDEYLLDIFKQAVSTNTSIGHDGRGCSQIAVRSDIMAKDLARYGVIPRKSFETFLPNIPADMIPHLIRGIMDGDGSVKAKQTNIQGRYAHSISFCGSHHLMQDIADWCANNAINTTDVYDYKNKSLSEIKIQSIDSIYKFGEIIYKNATVYMERKYKLYQDFKNHYNL